MGAIDPVTGTPYPIRDYDAASPQNTQHEDVVAAVDDVISPQATPAERQTAYTELQAFVDRAAQGGDYEKIGYASMRGHAAYVLTKHDVPIDADGSGELAGQALLAEGGDLDQLDPKLLAEIRSNKDDRAYAADLLNTIGSERFVDIMDADIGLARHLLSSAGRGGDLAKDFNQDLLERLAPEDLDKYSQWVDGKPVRGSVDASRILELTGDPDGAPMSDAFLKAAADWVVPRSFYWVYSSENPSGTTEEIPGNLDLLSDIAATSPAASAAVLAKHADGFLINYADDNAQSAKNVRELIEAGTGPEARNGDKESVEQALAALIEEVKPEYGIGKLIPDGVFDAIVDAYANNTDLVADGAARYDSIDGVLDQKDLHTFLKFVMMEKDLPDTLDDPAGRITIATSLAAQQLTTQAAGFPPDQSDPNFEKAGVLLGTFADASGEAHLALERERIGEELSEQEEAALREQGASQGLAYALGTLGTLVGLVPHPAAKAASVGLGLTSGAVRQFASSAAVNEAVNTNLVPTLDEIQGQSIDDIGKIRNMVLNAQIRNAVADPSAPGAADFIAKVESFERREGTAVLERGPDGAILGLRDPLAINDPTERAAVQQAIADLGVEPGTVYDNVFPIVTQIEDAYGKVRIGDDN